MQMGWNGDIGGAWRAYDEKLSGRLSLKEFDRDSFELLNSLRVWVQMHYGSVKLAFQALSKDANGELPCTEFKRALQRLHWQGDLRTVLTMVDSRKDFAAPKRTIACRDLEFLDHWLPQVKDDDDEDFSEEEDCNDSPKLPSIHQSRKSKRRCTRRKSVQHGEDVIEARNDGIGEDAWYKPSLAFRSTEITTQWAADLPDALGEKSLARWCARSGNSNMMLGKTTKEFRTSCSLPQL